MNYLPMLELLLASHRVSNPSVPLLVHAIGWSKDQMEAAQVEYPNATFQYQPPTSDAPEEMKGPVPRSASILKLKVEYLYRAHQASKGSVLWVDADTLLLDPLQPMIERIEQNGDFGVTERAGKRAHARFAVAVMCFTQTQAACRLMELYASLTSATEGLCKRRDTDGVAWFHDQLGLWRAYQQLSKGLFGIAKRDRPKLVQLRDDEHSIDGNAAAIFISRRDQLMEQSNMQQLLKSRGMMLKSLCND